MKRDQRVLEIIKNKVTMDYKDDISMLVVYGTNKMDVEDNLGISFYFIPKSERGKNLSTQFIIEGVSYDLFPISWERLIANAAMDSPQGYLLLDTEVIYHSDDEDYKKFQQLKNSLQVVLSGDYDDALLNKAYEYFNDCYIYLYNMQAYKDSMSSVRLEAGKLLNKVANALAFANSEYYSHGNGTILRESLQLKKCPRDYKELVNSIIFAHTSEEIHSQSQKLVKNMRSFLIGLKKEQKQGEAFELIFTGYFEELKKSINKCINAVEQKDYYKMIELFTYIQEEVSQFQAKVEEGIWYDNRNAYCEYAQYFESIFKVDFLELTALKDDDKILSALHQFEKDFVSLIKEEDLILLDFDSVEDFENYFREK